MMQTGRVNALKRMGKATMLAVVAALFLAAPQIGSAEGVKEVKANQVVVTATKTEKKLKEVPASVDVVTEKEIDANPQQTVADLLRDIPGVQVQDVSVAGLKRVVIRGESPARTLVMIDGQKISEQKSMDGAMLLLDSSDIERIEVIKGPASVLHGSEAIGGVVNIITKKGGKRPVQASAKATFDSSNNGLTSYGSVYGSKNQFNYRLSAGYTDAGDRISAKRRIGDSSYMNRNLSAFLGYDWEDATLSGKYENFWSNSNVPLVSSFTSPPPMTFNLDLDLPKWTRDKYALFFEKENISDVLAKFKVDGFYQETYKDFVNQMSVIPPAPAPTTNLLIHAKNDQDTWGLNSQLEWTLGESHYVITGLAVNLDGLKAKDRRLETRLFPPPVPPVVVKDDTYTIKAKQDTYALFVQDEWNFAPSWLLTAGVRGTYVRSELTSTDNPALRTGSSTSTRPVGSIGVVYSGFENWNLRANFAQGYRLPNLQQLYTGTGHGSATPTLPDPDLEAETSNDFEIGARYNDGAWNIDSGIYYTVADNYITMKNIPGGRQYTNADKATIMGLELMASYTFVDWGLTPYFNGTYMRHKYETENETTWETGDPNFFGRYGVRYEYLITEDCIFDADLYSRFASRAKLRGSTDNPWETYNLATGIHWGKERKFHLTLNLNNLADREYTEANTGLVAPGFHSVLQFGLDI